jgi:hypothetical protein
MSHQMRQRILLAAAAVTVLGVSVIARVVASPIVQSLPPPAHPEITQNPPEHAASHAYNRALGVDCSHCHVGDNFADDSKPTFDFARRMERMARGLSDGPLKDLGGVTCWSCHRGHAIPSRLPDGKWEAIGKAHAADLSGGRKGLDLAMGVYSASLGVECSHCHVDGNSSDGSRRAHQLVGRMTGMFTLIPSYFVGSARQPLTQCYMCHQGSVHVERD